MADKSAAYIDNFIVLLPYAAPLLLLESAFIYSINFQRGNHYCVGSRLADETSSDICCVRCKNLLLTLISARLWSEPAGNLLPLNVDCRHTERIHTGKNLAYRLNSEIGWKTLAKKRFLQRQNSSNSAFYGLLLCCLLMVWPVLADHGLLKNADPHRRARIVFTSEIPRIAETEQGDYAELATLLKQYRRDPVPLFFLFGGDSLGPSTLSSFDRGAHIIDLLNLLEPDAMGVAKREFSFYEDELSQRSYEASFPMVASNLFDPITGANLDGLESSVLVQQGSVKLGIIAVLSPAAQQQYPLKRVMIFDAQTAVREQAAALRQAGAELVVLLYTANFDFIEPLLKQQIVDVALRKNELFRLTTAVKKPESERHINLMASSEVAVLDLQWHQNEPAGLKVQTETLLLKNFAPEPLVLNVVKTHTARLEQLLGEKIGVTQVVLDSNRRSVRSEENVFANLMADAIRHHAGADIALINAGNIRGEKQYPAGTTLTRRDIAMELPYRNQVVLVPITGQQLRLALENAFSEFELLRGRFAHVSGMHIRFDSSKKVGERVVDVTIQGKNLEPTHTYNLATFDYLANGGDGYTMLVELTQQTYANQMNKLVAEVVVDYIKQQTNIAPALEGRLQDLRRPAP